jgi:hypothetical protein
MSMSNLAYARLAFQFFSRSARHIYQLIAGHQNPETGWAYLSYACLAKESGLTPRRVMQLVAFLEANYALEVRRGHGRGHVNFYRILREEDGLPVPHRSHKKVKSETRPYEEKVKFPTPPEPEKVKSETPNSSESLQNVPDKVVETKEREKKGAPLAPFSLWPKTPARTRCGWGGCDAVVCLHEVNFCAGHALCQTCAREGGADGQPPAQAPTGLETPGHV